MKMHLLNDEKQVFESVKYLPAISVILPFEPRINPKAELEYRVKMALRKVEQQLLETYPAEKALPVLHRLTQLLNTLNYYSHKKGIAIFLSPVIEKLFYLDVPVTEKIVIDESFEIRDLVYARKQMKQYLVLVLHANKATMYLGNGAELHLIKSNHADHFSIDEKDLSEKVANFTDPESREEILLNKFLHQMDQGLSVILKSYPLPVFILGTERVFDHFKKITKNEKAIVQFIHGNGETATESNIMEGIAPFIDNWQKVKELDLLHQLEKARDVKKLAIGINEVWNMAEHKNCRLLVVEKDFMYSARKDSSPDEIYSVDQFSESVFYIKDAVDDVMQKILEGGGDVEFVDNNVLEKYGRIALIQYFN